MNNGCRSFAALQLDAELKELVRTILGELARCQEDIATFKQQLDAIRTEFRAELAEHQARVDCNFDQATLWLEALQEDRDRACPAWDTAAIAAQRAICSD
jgi:hypothetical protein